PERLAKNTTPAVRNSNPARTNRKARDCHHGVGRARSPGGGGGGCTPGDGCGGVHVGAGAGGGVAGHCGWSLNGSRSPNGTSYGPPPVETIGIVWAPDNGRC